MFLAYENVVWGGIFGISHWQGTVWWPVSSSIEQVGYVALLRCQKMAIAWQH